MINLNGKWKGTLVFGREYGRDAGKELYFQMDLQHEGDTITAVAKDTGGFGMSPDPAKISGTFTNGVISFKKYYESFHTVDEKGTLVVDPSKKGPDILYNGVYDPATESFKGGWSIAMLVNQGNRTETFTCTGTWTMSQEK